MQHDTEHILDLVRVQRIIEAESISSPLQTTQVLFGTETITTAQLEHTLNAHYPTLYSVCRSLKPPSKISSSAAHVPHADITD